MKKILVAGSLNMDMVIHVHHQPCPGETVLGKSLVYSPGGKGANQAFAAGRLGAAVQIIGCVGNDAHGRTLMDNLKKADVDTRTLTVVGDAPTGLAVITVDDNAQNSITVISGANFSLTPALVEKQEAVIASCDYVLTQLETPVDSVCALARLSRKYGRCMILDPAPARRDLPDELFAQIDIIKPNETELEILTGIAADTDENIEKAAKILMDKGVKTVVVTLGARGAALIDRQGMRFFKGHKVVPADTTAAGDTFTAALAAGLAEGMTMETAIAFANQVASVVVTRAGAQTSIPDKEEVRHIMKSYKTEVTK